MRCEHVELSLQEQPRARVGGAPGQRTRPGTRRRGLAGGRGGMGVGGVEEAHWGVGAKGYAGEEGIREAGREGKGP